MLFITNRVLKEGKKFIQNRTISFDMEDSEPTSSIFFCERNKKNSYIELGGKNFLKKLQESKSKQILLYIHGFNNLPEEDIFPRAEKLQQLCNASQKNLIEVVPLIWPCHNQLGILRDYWDDQKSAEASAPGFGRMLGKFLDWRDGQEEDDDPCYKRINILSHSMGNRILRLTLKNWAEDYGAVGGIFRNIFMVAADIANESLEPRESGYFITEAARNVVVYHASDDFALRSSKVTNLKNKVVTKRLGHSGPENLDRCPNNVYAIDCDDFNNTYDKPKGHSYFLENGGDKPGSVFKHILHAMKKGRVDSVNGTRRKVLSKNYRAPTS